MKNSLNIIQESPIIPVFYNDDIEICKKTLSACYAGGIRIFEFVNRGQNAGKNFEKLLQFKNDNFQDLKLGIGTIKTTEQAEDFAQIGAEFLVSPIVKAELSAVANKYNLLWIPGCMTTTEIALAEELGAELIKLFPGDTLGINFLTAIKPLFPNLKFMITGGVDISLESIQSWRKAGGYALGLGSKLFVQPIPDEGTDYLAIRCKNLLQWALQY